MIKGYEGTYYGNFRQKSFSDVYADAASFVEDYKTNGLPTTITDDSASTLFYLLYGLYGHSTIASSDINQFKYQLFGIVYMYGPAWEKRIAVQTTLRTLTEDQLLVGSRQIYNHAVNPDTPIAEDTDDTGTLVNKEITYVSDQNVAHNTKSYLEAYGTLMTLLETDVTKEFVDKFKKLFLVIVQSELPLYYESDVEDENE